MALRLGLEKYKGSIHKALLDLPISQAHTFGEVHRPCSQVRTVPLNIWNSQEGIAQSDSSLVHPCKQITRPFSSHV